MTILEYKGEKMTIGMLIRVNNFVYKVTRVEGNFVWGALVTDFENKTCRRGRPSKFSINEVSII